MNNRINKKRKFVTDGVFFAELNELLLRKIAQFGYSGVEVRRTPSKTEIIIRATDPLKIYGEGGKGVHELKSLIQKRFNFSENTVSLFLDRILVKGLDAQTQAQSIHYKLMNGLAVRRACYSAIKFITEADAQGCEIIISGKLRGQRAQSMKFASGYMVKSGDAVNKYVDVGIRHAKMRQGILGIKVKIMKRFDPKGRNGPDVPLPDYVKINDPFEERRHDRNNRNYGGKGFNNDRQYRGDRQDRGDRPERQERGDRPERGGYRGRYERSDRQGQEGEVKKEGQVEGEERREGGGYYRGRGGRGRGFRGNYRSGNNYHRSDRNTEHQQESQPVNNEAPKE